MSRRTDPRYGTRHWQQVRAQVLRRDHHACRIVAGCTTRATVADHVVPVGPEMPDALFFSPANLRAACREHNLARGFAARLEAPALSTDVVTKDYSA